MTRNEKRAELIEKINDLITYCRTERIPAFFAADFDPTGQREMITRSVTPAALNLNLSDDAITQFSLLENKKLKITLRETSLQRAQNAALRELANIEEDD